MTEQGSDVLNVASFVHEMSCERMAQDMWMRKAFWNNTNKAAFNDIANLLASEFCALLGNKEPIGKRDVLHFISKPMTKKSSAIITKWDNSFLIALANNTDSVIGKINIFHCQRLQLRTPYAGMIK